MINAIDYVLFPHCLHRLVHERFVTVLGQTDELLCSQVLFHYLQRMW